MQLFLALIEQYNKFQADRSKIINGLNDKVLSKRDRYHEKTRLELYRDHSDLRREYQGIIETQEDKIQPFEEELKEEEVEERKMEEEEETKVEPTWKTLKVKGDSKKKIETEILTMEQKALIEAKHHELVLENLPEEYAFVHRKEGIFAGFPVYKKRNEWIVYLVGAVILYGFLNSFLNSHITVFTALVVGLTMLFITDFQTGFLHIILDNRISYNIPILSQPCLEFLWHHINPTDVGDRYCVDIFGDLNVIMILSTGLIYYWRMTLCKDVLMELIASFQLTFIYFAIYCHHLSHSRSRNRGWLTDLASAHHKIHHLGDHDEHFCLIGLGDFFVGPLNTYLPKLIGNKGSYVTYICGMIGLLLIHPVVHQGIMAINNYL
jgi:hypothetical protein